MLKTNNILLTLLTAFAASGNLQAAETLGQIPKVVVNIVVDQLRTDLLQAFMPYYSEVGLKKLLQEGRVYTNAEYPMSSIDRASSLATVSTGSCPSYHGIVGLRWIDREQSSPIFCVTDNFYKGIGTHERYSAASLNTSTVGDELKIASKNKSLVVSLAPNVESAILQAGHSADQVLWIDDTSGQWVTSTYYSPSLPHWVKNHNLSLKENNAQIIWEPSGDTAEALALSITKGTHAPFRHVLKSDLRFRQWKTSGLINAEIASASADLINAGQIGADEITDYLALTLFAGNYLDQDHLGVTAELKDTYIRLDAAIAQILQTLDTQIGKEGYLLSFTSTGYTQEDEKADLTRYRIPTGTFDMKRAAGLLAIYLRAVYSIPNLVCSTYGTEIYLDHKVIADNQISHAELLSRCQDFLQQLAGVNEVYTSTRLLQSGWTPDLAKKRNSYNNQNSGDLNIEVSPGWRIINTGTDREIISRMSYVPFPIIFYGVGVVPDTVNTITTVDYIAPTLSHAMRIRPPNACRHRPLF